jgi:hypothetical protein
MEEFKRLGGEEGKSVNIRIYWCVLVKLIILCSKKREKGVNNTRRETSFSKFNRRVLNFTASVKKVQLNGLTMGGQLNVQ